METEMNPPIVEVKDDKLIITIDLSKDEGRSKRGNSVLISSTHGFMPIPGKQGIAVNMNIIKNK
jgi:hypothetical protein